MSCGECEACGANTRTGRRGRPPKFCPEHVPVPVRTPRPASAWGVFPCSGCGKPVRGRLNRLGKATCHECRRIEPRYGLVAELECWVCGREFVRRGKRVMREGLVQTACSQSCGATLANWRRRAAADIPGAERKKASVRARRAAKAMTWDGVPDEEILERDGWRCQVPDCLFRSRAIPRDATYPHPRSASVDHIVPLSVEPNDTAVNKRAAHLRCNVVRGNRMGDEQLPLFGTLREAPVMVMVGTKRVVERPPRPPKPKPPRAQCRSCGAAEYEHAPGCLHLLTDEQRRLLGLRMAAMRAEGVRWDVITPMFGYKSIGAAYNVMAHALSRASAA